MGRRVVNFSICFFAFILNAASQLHLPPVQHSNAPFRKAFLLPQNFYTQHRPFFCKKEDQLQKRTGMNLFFRLGTKDYVDWLERKPNARRQ